jgi:hypothetical protein
VKARGRPAAYPIAPTITSAVINAAGTQLTATFSHVIQQGANTNTPSADMSGGAVTLTYVSGANTAQRVYSISRTIAPGETGTLAYTQLGDGYKLLAAPLTLVATFSGFPITNNAASSAPTLFSATIGASGTTLTLVFSQSVSVGAGGNGGWVLSMSGGASAATYASGSGSTALVYNLARTIQFDETGTLAYTQPGNGIEGTVGGVDVASIGSAAVTNDSSQGSSDPIIPLDRVIDWDPGVPGGIPNRTTIFAIVTNSPYNCPTDGTSDCSPAIQSALNACPDDQVVSIPTGTFRLNSTLTIPNRTVLRGAGPTLTTLNCYMSTHAVQIGAFPANSYPNATDTSVSGSPAKGDTQITVGSVSTPHTISVGSFICIDQTDDGVEVVNVDTASRDGSTRGIGQIVQVTAIAGTLLTIDPPLYHDYPAARTPQVWLVNQGSNNTTQYSGVEDLKIERVSPTTGTYLMFRMLNCAFCWVKNVESKLSLFRHVDFDRCYRCEARDSYFNDGRNHGTGGYAYGVVCAAKSTACLVENNIFRHLRHSMVLDEGASGNVIAYNYSLETYQGVNWLAPDMISHGTGPHMNLFESNWGTKFHMDKVHGSSSYQTGFRNHVRRDSTPAETAITQARRCVDLEATNRYHNIVGNVLGEASQSWDAYDPGTSRNAAGGRYVYCFGYPSDGAASSTDANSLATVYRHGNFDYQSNSTIWDAGNANHTLPASLYLTAKPAFFGSDAWPCIGSDLSPKVGTLPAKTRYEAL